LENGDEVLAIPWHGITDSSQAVRPVDEPGHGHREEQVRIVGVRLAPVFSYPRRDVVVFASNVAERPCIEDRVIGPWSRLSGRAAEADGLTLGDEVEQTGYVHGVCPLGCCRVSQAWSPVVCAFSLNPPQRDPTINFA
jgi:hypothetical protein